MAVAAQRIPSAHKHNMKVRMDECNPWYIVFACSSCYIKYHSWRNHFHLFNRLHGPK